MRGAQRDAASDTEYLSAYRFHTADPLVMADGGALTWQVGAKWNGKGKTKCGNDYTYPTPAAELAAKHRVDGLGRTNSAVNVTIYGWVYVFPTGGKTIADETVTSYFSI